MKRFFIIFTIVAALTTGLSSQELSGNNQGESQITDNSENRIEHNSKICAVSVTGLKRTKPYIIENLLKKFIGMDAESVDVNDVIAIVKSTGVLEPLSVEITDNQEGNGKTLEVTVRDKWSIFPIPFGGINSSGWSAGGVLVDANVFGIKDTAMLMGLFGPGDLTASFMYIHSPKAVGEFGWNFMGFFSRQENENTDQTGEQILRRYNSMSIHPLAGLSYSLSEHIMPGLSLAYRYVALRDTESPINAPENGIQGITLSPSIHLRFNNIWDGYFLNEKSFSLKYEYTFVIGGDDVHSVSVNANFNHSLIPGFKFTAKSGMVFATSSASPFFESSPMSAAVNILPTSYSAAQIAGVSLGLEKHLFKFSQGTLSLSAAYQGVYSHGYLLDRQFDHGPVAMLLMYFSKLALPAVGLGGSYNVAKNTWQYAFNMGMQF
jgi:outer membrane protein assembly factor BamA